MEIGGRFPEFHIIGQAGAKIGFYLAGGHQVQAHPSTGLMACCAACCIAICCTYGWGGAPPVLGARPCRCGREWGREVTRTVAVAAGYTYWASYGSSERGVGLRVACGGGGGGGGGAGDGGTVGESVQGVRNGDTAGERNLHGGMCSCSCEGRRCLLGQWRGQGQQRDRHARGGNSCQWHRHR